MIVRPQTYERQRSLWRTEPLITVRGVLQRRDGVTNVVAAGVEPLPVRTVATPEAKSFR